MTYKFTTIIIQEGKWFIARCRWLVKVKTLKALKKISQKRLNFIFSRD